MTAAQKLNHDITYFLHEVNLCKREIEYYTTIHKYAGKALNDIERYGWSNWESLFERPEGDSKLVAAQRFFHGIVKKLLFYEEELTRVELQYGEAIHKLHDLKTKSVQDAERFERVWNNNIIIETPGKQVELF